MKLNKEKITLELARQGLTFKELADNVGVAQCGMSNYFTKNSNNPKTIYKIAKVLDVDFMQIVDL